MLLPQPLQLGDASGFQELADLLRGALADAVDPLQLLDGQHAEIGRLRRDRLRRALVGADAKRLRVALVQQRQLGQIPQHLQHVFLAVRHGWCCSLRSVTKKGPTADKAPRKSAEAAETLVVAGREVRVSHPDKPYFSREAKLSKLDLVRYYLSVADGALAGIRDRPIVLKRFVDGAEGEAFYQKRAPDKRPGWLRTVTLAFPSGRTAEELVVDDAAGLAFIVNLGCIELHPHPVRAADLEHPDELRVDLDPGPGVAWADVRRVALEEGGVRAAGHELVVGEHADQKVAVRGHAVQARAAQSGRQAPHRAEPRGRPRDDLGQHRVVVGPHDGARRVPRVHPHALASGDLEPLESPR